MRLLYTFSILVYRVLVQLVSLFNEKAKLWLNGRKDWSKTMERELSQWSGAYPKVWIHCASLGEFEQGRPLIEWIKKEQATTKIVLSFFSPSGFEIRKDYPLADLVVYLPLDTPGQARKFIQILQPKLAIFVKYEFWYNHLWELQKAQIPFFLIAGLFRPKQHFFRWYGAWFRKHLKGFEHLFLQNESSAALLKRIEISQFSVVGDPRIDRVLALAKQPKNFPEIEGLIAGRRVLIAGSSWPADERLLIPLSEQHLDENWLVIIAPHDIKKSHIQEIEESLNCKYIKYSELKEVKELKNYKVLIIDNIGMLSSLYNYADIAYIGGGFGSGIHNTLEPIAYGIPVIFGPKYHKFEEANYLVKEGGGYSINDLQELKDKFFSLMDSENYEYSCTMARKYIEQNQGATQKIYQTLLKHLPINGVN